VFCALELWGTTPEAALPFRLAELTHLACTAGASATAGALSLARRGGLSLSKAHLPLGLLLSVGVLAIGALVHGLQPGANTIPSEQKPNSSAEVLSIAADRFGDVLPPGATVRLGTVRYRTRGAACLAFLPDGKTILAGATFRSGDVAIIDCRSGECKRQINIASVGYEFPCCLAQAPDGRSFAVAGVVDRSSQQPGRGLITIWDVESGRIKRSFERGWAQVSFMESSMALSGDGTLLASIERSGKLRIEDVVSGQELLNYQLLSGKNATPDYSRVAISAHGSCLAFVLGANKPQLYAWNWRNQNEPRKLTPGLSDGTFLQFSPDGKKLVDFTYESRFLRLWDVASGNLLRTIKPFDRDFERRFPQPPFD
jgi:WD40 repeat protein